MASIGAVGEVVTVKRAVTWLGGPYDGARTLVEPDAEEYAVAYDAQGERVTGPKVQNYVTDLAYWLKDRDRRIAEVRVFPISWTAGGHGEIHWHSRRYRVIEYGSQR